MQMNDTLLTMNILNFQSKSMLLSEVKLGLKMGTKISSVLIVRNMNDKIISLI